MTFLMHSLSERYSRLGEETRLSSLTDLLTFSRQGQERIDDLISRFDTVRQAANNQGQLALSFQGLAWILLRACQVNDMQLMQLLQPFGGLFPSNQAEYAQLTTLLRRMGHIIERSPGNIAGLLRGQPPGHSHNQRQAFLTTDGTPSDVNSPAGQTHSDSPWSQAFMTHNPMPANGNLD